MFECLYIYWRLKECVNNHYKLITCDVNQHDKIHMNESYVDKAQ